MDNQTTANPERPYDVVLRVLQESNQFTPEQQEALAKAVNAAVVAGLEILGASAKRLKEEAEKKRS